ncbi:MAG TPA: AAA family ATPase [Gaiellaceae bacterium]|jgi:predicted kinase|nr:AAA family ATPase [Gaiellaceae bacterium]
MDDLPRLIVVTGPPGAGKTTIATALQARLGLPLIAKDALKETLGGALGIEGRARSEELGPAVFDLLGLVVRELLEHGVSVIAEGNFRERSTLFSGLPRAEIVQVHVTATPETLRARLRGRNNRHPVHYDREAADEVSARAARGEWPPLAIGGRLIEIDTTVWPELDEVLATV